MSDQGGQRLIAQCRQSQDGSKGAMDRTRLRQRGKLDKANLVGIGIDKFSCDGEGDRRLADAAGPDDGHETAARQLVRNGAHALGTADHACERRRQTGRRVGNRRSGDGRVDDFVDPSHRGDEAIASAGHRIDVLVSGSFAAKQLAQRGDVNPQIGFFDESVRPDAFEQIFLADELFSVFNERNQEIECAAAKANRFAVAGENAARWIKTKRPKG